ncbi:ephrin-B2a [Esox lucius]|uniref:Ephrin RBD domain-containing protein n=1 Tax=Esox lucius TaxID=8010 RepID=A0AAY5KA85_ESOLU|nr:ephrin-B2a [Esox lucius]
MGLGSCAWGFYVRMLVLAMSPRAFAVILESIYWNSSNTKFSPGQGLVLYPQIGDKMDILCPRTRPEGGSSATEYYRVYLVTRDQLHSCTVSQSDTPLLNCDKPDQDVKFTFKFQEFSPNLWGLEFLKGRDYYITSTSTGTLQGLDNPDGGVCRVRSMKLVLRVGQSSSASSPPKDSPTRFPPRHPKPRVKDPTVKGNDTAHGGGDADREGGASPGGGPVGSEVGLYVGVACGCAILLLATVILLVAVCRYHRRHAKPHGEGPQPTSLPLNALVKSDSYGGDGDRRGSGPGDAIFPPRPSDMFCRHYERVGGDYGHPVYIVQEVATQSPTNVYYKV